MRWLIRTCASAAITFTAPAGVSSAYAEQPHERVSSWRTTVATAAPPERKRLTTGAIAPAPEGVWLPSLAGRHHALEGIASFYWQDQKTANGERFDKAAMTAAHKTLPFNTRVRVTHLGNGRSVVVRINDRGPFKPGRVIDLSDAAAGALEMRGQGLARVRIDVIGR